MKPAALCLLLFACILAPPASANSTYTWDFATPPNAFVGSNTHTYSTGGISIIVIGSTGLYYKVSGGDETGLGLVGKGDHEIGPGESIVLNLSSLFSKNVTNLTLMLGSIQKGEFGTVCDAFSDCMTFGHSSNFTPVSIMSLYLDMKGHHNGLLTVRAGAGDVLVDQLRAYDPSTAPEPSSLVLMGTGLLAMGGGIRRKFRG